MAALADLVAALAAGDVADATCSLLSSATLVVLIKKYEAEMEALREKQGAVYMQQRQPLGMRSAIPKLAASCVLESVQPTIGVAAGANQFAVNTKGGCGMVQWVLQIIMEAEPDLGRSCLDASNAFGDLDRPCIQASLDTNVARIPSSPSTMSSTP
jgi:hypothetical protein